MQRLSVYIQRNDGPVTLSPGDADVKNPYIETAKAWRAASPKETKADPIMPDRNGIPRGRNDTSANIMDVLTALDNGRLEIKYTHVLTHSVVRLYHDSIRIKPK